MCTLISRWSVCPMVFGEERGVARGATAGAWGRLGVSPRG